MRRLDSLTIRNLGPLREVKIEPVPPVLLVMGDNDAGKSFLLDALGLLRFGSTRGVKVGEALDLARSGSSGWSVEAVVRVVDGAQPLALKRTRSTAPDLATLDGALGDPRTWRAIVDARHALDMTPEDRRALVADLLARDTTELVGELRAKGAPDVVVRAVEAGDVRKANRLATEERRAIDRLLRDQQAIVSAGADDPEVPTKSGPRRISTIDADTIRTALDRARKVWADATAAQSRAARVEQARAAALQARADLEAMPATAAAWSEQDEAGLASLREKLAKADAVRQACGDEARTLRATQDRLVAALARKGEAPCPTCGQALSDEAAARIQAAADEARREAVASVEKLREAVASWDGVRVALEAAERRKADAEADAKARARLRATIEAGERAEAEEGPSVLPDVAKREVDRVTSLLEARTRYDGRAEAVAAAQARVLRLDGERKRAAEFEELTLPEKMEDEADALGQINRALAEFSEPVLGQGGRVYLDDAWNVKFSVLTAAHRAELMSDSTRIRAALALTIALSTLSGIGIVLVDRLEALSDDARSRTIKLLGSLVESGRLTHALCARVSPTRPPPATLPGWLGRLWVEGGVATPF